MEIAFAVGQTKQCDVLRVYSHNECWGCWQQQHHSSIAAATATQPLAQLNALITLFSWCCSSCYCCCRGYSCCRCLCCCWHCNILPQISISKQTAGSRSDRGRGNLRQSRGNCKWSCCFQSMLLLSAVAVCCRCCYCCSCRLLSNITFIAGNNNWADEQLNFYVATTK